MMKKEDYLNQYDEHQYMRDNVANDPYRLRYHLMPPTGFLNDPNGLFQKDGIYHIYFQYTPYSTDWGTKLWGHYTTKDMIIFQQEEPFLYPDISSDRDGVYSGSAFVEDDVIHYFYTGNVKLTDREYDYIQEGREQNTIHMTSQNGYEYSQKELILTNEDYPQDMSKHVRDPKIFKKDQYYYMVLGGRTRDNKGCVLLYRSQDLKHFEYYNRIETPYQFGYMWECPDLFELDGHLFLMTCPQGVENQGYHYENIYQTGYFEVYYDFNENTYTLSEFKELDHGFDIYAPQSFVDEKGRRIQYAWMGIPDAIYHNQPTVEHDWIHALTMPKELKYKDGEIIQEPLEEMKELRINEVHLSICDWNQQAIHSVCFEMNVHFDKKQEFDIQLRNDVHLIYRNNLLTLSMVESGCGRDVRHVELDEIEELTVFSDTSSLEIFINGGRIVLTTRVYSSLLEQYIQINSKGKGKVSFYELSGYQINN